MQNKQIIILNGRKYDAITGKLIGGSLSDIIVPSKPNSSSSVVQPAKPKFIDGFSGGHTNLLPKPNHKEVVSGRSPHHSHHKAQDVKRQPAKSKTLMRKPLVKPTLAPKGLAQPVKKTSYVSRSIPAVLHRPIHNDSLRGSLINRTQTFKTKASEVVNNITSAPPIVPPNVHERTIQKINESDDDQLYKMATSEIVEPKVVKKKKGVKKRLLSVKGLYISAGVLLLLIILGVGGWYFKYDLDLTYANLKTGINGSFPSYIPLGYKIDKFSYTKNAQTASISFQYHPAHSVIADNLYITESSTTLDNGALISTDVGPVSQEKYQTLSVSGLSVYHYTDQYIWINAGILYILTNESGLDQPTVLQIINSI